jgi:hypothetical protein
MGDLILPQPTKTARDVYEVTGAILESIPGVGVLKKFTDIYLNRRIEEELNKIVHEVRASGIGILTETQFEFYLPSAYRFAEQVRLGDYEHNLRILRKILMNGLRASSTDTGKIGRHARQLEYLSEFEIDVLAAAYELGMVFADRVGEEGFVSPEGIVGNIARFSNSQLKDVKYALGNLHSRGLLVLDGNSAEGGEGALYDMSPDGASIVISALKS